MTVIVINHDGMGHGSDVLGKKLIGAFLKKLWATSDQVDKIILYNSGVKLMTKQSGHLDALTGLSEAGVEVLGCGTCIDDFGIGDEVAVGMVSNMESIVAIMHEADKVITV